MASTINASTTAGLVQTADTSGVLALQTANTTAVSISASQVVTLTNALPVASGGSGVTTSTGTGANVLGTSPTITTPIVSTTMGVGGATPSGSGSGITFPATQSASSNANTLDDYEEGTFTPVASQTSSNPTVTYANQTGSYVKVGNTVTIHIRLGLSTLSGGSGNPQITGLPFASSASSDAGIMFMQAYNNNTSGRYLMGYIGTNVTKIEIYSNDPASGFAQLGSYSSNWTVIIGFSYITNT